MCNITEVVCSQCSNRSNENMSDEKDLLPGKDKPSSSTKSSQTLFSAVDVNQNIINAERDLGKEKNKKSVQLSPVDPKTQLQKDSIHDSIGNLSVKRSVQFGNQITNFTPYKNRNFLVYYLVLF